MYFKYKRIYFKCKKIYFKYKRMYFKYNKKIYFKYKRIISNTRNYILNIREECILNTTRKYILNAINETSITLLFVFHIVQNNPNLFSCKLFVKKETNEAITHV